MTETPVLLVRMLTILLILSLSACANVYKAKNKGIDVVQTDGTYRMDTFRQVHQLGDNLVILAFSGGGTRAAALSYGVMQELRDTRFIDSRGHSKSLLETVDYISAVSGGSFTAGYYAAFGEEIFETYEQDFLRQSIEGALLGRLLSPRHWFRSLWSGFDRTEMAIEYYDERVFKGRRFGDIPLGQRPFILINATDLSMGARFVFDQDSFDWICADLNDIKIARAVTASSAVPLAFPSVVLKNRGGECDMQASRLAKFVDNMSAETVKQKSYIEAVRSYQDSEKRPYIHLIDGGISDNLGLRAVSDQLEVFGVSHDPQFSESVKRVIVILVNSAVKPSRLMDQSPYAPAIGETVASVTTALMEHYEEETKAYFFDKASEFKIEMAELNPDIKFYLAEVAFEDLPEDKNKSFFNNLPTSLELSEAQIDAVIAAGRKLLREQRTFIELKQDLAAQIQASPEASNFMLEQQIMTQPDQP